MPINQLSINRGELSGLRCLCRRFFHGNGGQDLVEYALLAGVVALGAVAALGAFQKVIAGAWAAISANLSG